jgi:hypothetical protein
VSLGNGAFFVYASRPIVEAKDKATLIPAATVTKRPINLSLSLFGLVMVFAAQRIDPHLDIGHNRLVQA